MAANVSLAMLRILPTFSTTSLPKRGTKKKTSTKSHQSFHFALTSHAGQSRPEAVGAQSQTDAATRQRWLAGGGRPVRCRAPVRQQRQQQQKPEGK